MENKIQRRFTRWELDQEASLKLPGAKDICPCRVHNISLKGIELATDRELEDSKPHRLRLYFSDGSLFNIEGWIVWRKTAEGFNTYGLYFTRISDADKDKLYEYLVRHCPEQIINNMYSETFEEAPGLQTIPDRRDFERFPIKLSLSYCASFSQQKCQAQTNDMSASGLGLAVSQALVPQAPLELEVWLPDQTQFICMEAYVVWSEKQDSGNYRAGIKLQGAHFMELGRLLRTRPPA